MKAPVFAAALCCCVLLGSTAFAQENKPVEILRGPRRGPAKKTVEADQQATAGKKVEALKAQEQSLKAREEALDAREGSLKQREEAAAKTDEESRAKADEEKKAKAKREKALQDLARKTHGEFGNAADALAGE